MRKLFSVFLLIFSLHAMVSQELNREQIRGIVGKIPDLIRENYVFKNKGNEYGTTFQLEVNSGRYDNIKTLDSLAKRLSADLLKISSDRHLYVSIIELNTAEVTAESQSWQQQEQALELKQNYGFTAVQILDGNIGYLKIVEFMHPQRGMPTAVVAMKFVENSRGLIIDLRGNGGGYSGLMLYILNHFFDGGPTHISTTFYADQQPLKEYSSDLVLGKLRVDTPLFILINEKTGSAAEFFAYTLQAFKKAKIVGVPSAGAANRNSFYLLRDNFRISISTASPINPITKTNWESKGVQPDYWIEEDLLQQTIKLILKELEKH